MLNVPLANGTFATASYDTRNRLISIQNSNSLILNSYDAEGARIARTIDGVREDYVIDKNARFSRLLVKTKNSENTFFVYGRGLSYAVDNAGNATYFHFDQLGNTVAITDQSGNVIERVEYSPYGQVTHRNGTEDTLFLYGGKYGVQSDDLDGSLLYHMRARMYNPHTLRFLNQDPIGFAGGNNFYSYAGNDPMNYNDPLGLSASSPGCQGCDCGDCNSEDQAVSQADSTLSLATTAESSAKSAVTVAEMDLRDAESGLKSAQAFLVAAAAAYSAATLILIPSCSSLIFCGVGIAGKIAAGVNLAAAKADVDTAKGVLATAKFALGSAESTLASAQADLQKAQTNFNNAVSTAEACHARVKACEAKCSSN